MVISKEDQGWKDAMDKFVDDAFVAKKTNDRGSMVSTLKTVAMSSKDVRTDAKYFVKTLSYIDKQIHLKAERVKWTLVMVGLPVAAALVSHPEWGVKALGVLAAIYLANAVVDQNQKGIAASDEAQECASLLDHWGQIEYHELTRRTDAFYHR